MNKYIHGTDYQQNIVHYTLTKITYLNYAVYFYNIL